MGVAVSVGPATVEGYVAWVPGRPRCHAARAGAACRAAVSVTAGLPSPEGAAAAWPAYLAAARIVPHDAVLDWRVQELARAASPAAPAPSSDFLAHLDAAWRPWSSMPLAAATGLLRSRNARAPVLEVGVVAVTVVAVEIRAWSGKRPHRPATDGHEREAKEMISVMGNLYNK